MRQIKFRGKDKDGNWVYGDLIHGVGMYANQLFILPCVKNLANVPNCDPLNGVEVGEETICQFIGRHDEDGKEIYDGDYVEVNYKHEEMGENYGIIPDCDCICKGQVFWGEDEMTWTIKILKAEEPIKTSIMENDGLNEYYLSAFDLECARVLGNIYDNKDLIEV